MSSSTAATAVKPAHYRRIDTTDPRRHDRIQPLSFPAKWKDDSPDVYSFFLSSATMLSGAAMITRMPTLSFAGLLFAVANLVHEKPLQAKRDSAQNTNAAGGPRTGLAFAVLSIILIVFQKLLGVPLPGHAPAPSSSATAAVKAV